jgi:hypothetical protein
VRDSQSASSRRGRREGFELLPTLAPVAELHVAHSVAHLTEAALVAETDDFFTRERTALAGLLVRIAEMDARGAYLPLGYDSMYAYCVKKHGLSEDAACKRIRAARAGRKFPMIFRALEEGQLHLAGIAALAPRLTPENADELLRAAVGKSKAEVERLVADWFPKLDMPAEVRATSPRFAEAAADVANELQVSCAPAQIMPESLSAPGRIDTSTRPKNGATRRRALCPDGHAGSDHA